jgi:hypothetical protein
MTQEDLITHQFDYDIQRFMQIREQIHEEIKKIGTHVTTLDATNKRLISHFDVFKELSKMAQKEVSAAIIKAAQDMAKGAAQDFSKTIHESLSSELSRLNTSISNASYVLEETMGQKYRKLILFSVLGCLLFGFAGFGGGYIYAKRTAYEIPRDFFKMYERGMMVEEKKRQELVEKVKARKKK